MTTSNFLLKKESYLRYCTENYFGVSIAALDLTSTKITSLSTNTSEYTSYVFGNRLKTIIDTS